MSYQYHGTTDLIPLPGRSVQTYPSGLVRVERSFLCRKADVAKYRSTIRVNEPMPLDDGAPAIDGLYIFPEPQEIVRDDGFVEFRVTAYGRTNTTGLIENSSIIGDFSYTTSNSLPYGSAQAIMPQFTQRIVLLGSESPSLSFQPTIELLPRSVRMFGRDISVDAGALESNITSSFVPYEVWENYIMEGPSNQGLLYNGFTLYSGGSFNKIPHDAKTRRSYVSSKEITSTNFGAFQEYAISYSLFFTVFFTRYIRS